MNSNLSPSPIGQSKKSKNRFQLKFGGKLGVLAVVTAMMVSSTAEAGVLCLGDINLIRIRQDNQLHIDWGFNRVRLCSLSADYTYGTNPTYTITPEECNRVYTMALTALGSGQDFGTYFSNASTCTGIGGALPDVNGQPPNEGILYFYLQPAP